MNQNTLQPQMYNKWWGKHHHLHQKWLTKSQNIQAWKRTHKVILLPSGHWEEGEIETHSYWLVRPKSHICILDREKDQTPSVLGTSPVRRGDLWDERDITFKSQPGYILTSWLSQLRWVNSAFLSQDFLLFGMGMILISREFWGDFNSIGDTASSLPNVHYSFFLKGPQFWGRGSDNGPLSMLMSLMPKWRRFCQWLIKWGFLGKLSPCGIRPRPFLFPIRSSRKDRAGSRAAMSQSWKLIYEARLQHAEDSTGKRKGPGWHRHWIASPAMGTPLLDFLLEKNK